MFPRFHCNEEMDYIGLKDGLHWFECKMCQERECTKDPDAPTTPDETPRKSFLEYGSETTMDKNVYKR